MKEQNEPNSPAELLAENDRLRARVQELEATLADITRRLETLFRSLGMPVK
jgi:hypothetical protein